MVQPVGYFKVWRELYTKPIWTNSPPEHKVVLMTILAMANFRTNKWIWQGKEFEVKEGQFITSLSSLAKTCGPGVTIQNVRTALKKFETLGFLTNKSTKTGRLITIVNWELYQGENIQTNKANNKEPTKSQQSSNKELTTKEEGKEGKKVNNIIMTPYEAEYISILERIKDYPLDREKDLEYMKVLEERYPELDLVAAAEKFSDWVLDNPFKKNANHRSRLNDSFKKYVEWGICVKKEKPKEKKRGPLKLVIRDNVL